MAEKKMPDGSGELDKQTHKKRESNLIKKGTKIEDEGVRGTRVGM